MCKFFVTLYMKALLVIVEYHLPKLFLKLRVSRCQEGIKIKHYLALCHRVSFLAAAYSNKILYSNDRASLITK